MVSFPATPFKSANIEPLLTYLQNLPYNKQNIINLPISEEASVRSEKIRSSGINKMMPGQESTHTCTNYPPEPSRCSSQIWRDRRASYSSWVNATPACWPSFGACCDKSSSSATATSSIPREMRSSSSLTVPSMQSPLRQPFNVRFSIIPGQRTQLYEYASACIPANRY